MLKQSTVAKGTRTSQPRGFRPLAASAPGELFRQRPSGDGCYLEFTGECGFACFVRVETVRDMARWGRAAGGSEVIGRLGGRQCQDSTGHYVLVERATLCRAAHGSPAHVLADIAAQEALRRDFDNECRALDPVGWWHTHVGAVGLFYSTVDRENQASWTNPNSIGIVLAPRLEGEALKVFRGPKSVELNCVASNRVLQTLSSREQPIQDPPTMPMPDIPARRYEADVPSCYAPATHRSQINTVVAMCLASAALLFAIMTHILLWMSPQIAPISGEARHPRPTASAAVTAGPTLAPGPGRSHGWLTSPSARDIDIGQRSRLQGPAENGTASRWGREHTPRGTCVGQSDHLAPVRHALTTAAEQVVKEPSLHGSGSEHEEKPREPRFD